MKVSRTIAYAVQAILQLSTAPVGSPVACGQLAAEGRMPERFLLQILRKLVRAGILNSMRGVEGGYLLARPAEEITLLDIFEGLDNPLIPSVPPLEGLSDAARQRLGATLNRAFRAVEVEFAALSIRDLQHLDERLEDAEDSRVDSP